jgi:hypothetical protein
MSASVSYVSIALVGKSANGNIGIETISVSENEVTLAGAWEYEQIETNKIKSILVDRLVVYLDSETKTNFSIFSIKEFNLALFLKEAAESATNLSADFENYVSKNPKKYAKLVEPDIKRIPLTKFTNNWEILENLSGYERISGLDQNFQKIIKASWKLRDLILFWQHNESERVSRKYLPTSIKEFSMLPIGVIS